MKFYYLVRVLSESPRIGNTTNAVDARKMAKQAVEQFNAPVKVYRMKRALYRGEGDASSVRYGWDVPTFLVYADLYAEYRV